MRRQLQLECTDFALLLSCRLVSLIHRHSNDVMYWSSFQLLPLLYLNHTYFSSNFPLAAVALDDAVPQWHRIVCLSMAALSTSLPDLCHIIEPRLSPFLRKSRTNEERLESWLQSAIIAWVLWRPLPLQTPFELHCFQFIFPIGVSTYLTKIFISVIRFVSPWTLVLVWGYCDKRQFVYWTEVIIVTFTFPCLCYITFSADWET